MDIFGKLLNVGLLLSFSLFVVSFELSFLWAFVSGDPVWGLGGGAAVIMLYIYSWYYLLIGLYWYTTHSPMSVLRIKLSPLIATSLGLILFALFALAIPFEILSLRSGNEIIELGSVVLFWLTILLASVISGYCLLQSISKISVEGRVIAVAFPWIILLIMYLVPH